jgi:hypothetical protein
MSSGRTVFVLGAGASKPYGLPLGNELFREVVRDFSQHESHFHDGRGMRQLVESGIRKEFLNAAPFNQSNVDNFINALRYSGFTSVDEFLEKREEFVEIGKAIMALELLRREKGDALWEGDQNWMQYLYGKMATEKFEDFGTKNPASFITYNYDRTLEYFLHASLMNGYGKSSQECLTALKRVDVIHLHGRLCYLPWQGKKNIVEFGETQITPQILEMCQREIRIVHENIDDRDEEFNSARSFLREAERVYFMGYGYAPQNVDRLNFKEVKPRICEGTAVQLTHMERGSIIKRLGTVTLHDMNCLTFLRERVDWD